MSNDKAKIATSEQLIQFYHLLLDYGVKPTTVHTWLKLCRLPEDLRDRIRKRKLTQNQALRMFKAKKDKILTSLGAEVILECRNVVKELVANGF